VRLRVGRLAAALATASLAIALAGCGAAPEPSGPLGPCGTDAKSIGGYPVLEAVVPRLLDGKAPDTVDSGRNCSAESLGTLTTHGIHELRFAGATWSHGGGDATVIAVLATPSDEPFPQESWIEEFYTAGAVAGKHTDSTTTTRPVMEGAGQVFRLDTLNDLSLQSVVIWDDRGAIHVVIVATTVSPSASRELHEQRLVDAVKVAVVEPPA
jgi:hypothetical protein